MASVKIILILAANPKNTNTLRLDEEVREIEEGLRRSKHRKNFKIEHKCAVRIKDLRRALLDYSPEIVHFCGHAGLNGIILENERGEAVLVQIDALSELFEICADHVQCVILNACYSERQAIAISRHIDYVIGMSDRIGDKGAIEFAVGFYDGLGAGKSIEQAFKLGCSAIHLKDIPEHFY